MTEIKDYIALFDLDGVILDSEGDYTKFWDEMGKKYLGVSDFGISIKGQTLVKILGDNYRREDHEEITTQLMDYESKMPFEYIPGARRFLDALSRSGVRMAARTRPRCQMYIVGIRSFLIFSIGFLQARILRLPSHLLTVI